MWNEIEDIEFNLSRYRSTELESLVSIWREQRLRLATSKALQSFEQKLAREWAIETGIIENLYSIDRGVTQLLIERGIQASLIERSSTNRPVAEIVAILRDQQDTLEGLFDFVTERRELSTSYVKELHQSLTRHQPTTDAVDQLGRSVEVSLLRGDWKKTPNNPTRSSGEIHIYCPPEHVGSEMDRLVELHHQHIGAKISPEVSAAWLHHRFTQIHPFQDGNGRVARALGSIVLLKAGWFPLVINRDFREEYIESLERADDGNLKLLVDLICREQKKALVRALSISEDALRQEEPLARVIQLAKERLEGKSAFQEANRLATSAALAESLKQTCRLELGNIRDSLKAALSPSRPDFRTTVRLNDVENNYWFKHQIVAVAQQLDYFADTRTYRGWCSLRIFDEAQTDLVFAFHALGTNFSGVMAVSAFLQSRSAQAGADEMGPADSAGAPIPIAHSVFQFSYLEKVQKVDDRFKHWMKDALVIGLDIWQKQL